uniref:Phospholipid scramblase 1 n=1 Tax=Canis lupus familiaris TaxID=9615 RepID=A0A8C0QM88_CANLF
MKKSELDPGPFAPAAALQAPGGGSSREARAPTPPRRPRPLRDSRGPAAPASRRLAARGPGTDVRARRAQGAQRGQRRARARGTCRGVDAATGKRNRQTLAAQGRSEVPGPRPWQHPGSIRTRRPQVGGRRGPGQARGGGAGGLYLCGARGHRLGAGVLAAATGGRAAGSPPGVRGGRGRGQGRYLCGARGHRLGAGVLEHPHAAATELSKPWKNKMGKWMLLIQGQIYHLDIPLNILQQHSKIDQILIHQQIELLEVITGFETNNKYEIKNSFGQRIYFAAEDTDFCTRNCCGASRPFTIRILDNMGQEVITLERPLRCGSCCCPCCLQEIEIQAPPGVPVGYVNQTWHPCLPKFTIQNERREDVLKITGPCLVCSCCADVDFEIKSLDEENVVGKISKQWTGLVREAFTDTDNFGIQFPLDLDVKMKAVMLGACFLIDFMFFEKSGNNE